MNYFWQLVSEQDRENEKEVIAILEERGWVGRSLNRREGQYDPLAGYSACAARNAGEILADAKGVCDERRVARERPGSA